MDQHLKKGEDYAGVTVVYLCHDGRGNYLLNKRSNQTRDEHGTWDSGGGGLEFNDTVEGTLKKEIREEYCTDVIGYQFLGFRDIHRTNEGRPTHWIALDFKVLVDREKVKNGEPHKFDEVGWFKLEEFPRPLHSQLPFFLEKYKEKILEDYRRSLPRKRMASGVIVRNTKGEMLILKTTYKDHWEIPGGVVEENESPRQAAEREMREEIGLSVAITNCLVTHYRSAQGEQDENIMFVFDGGAVADMTQLKLDGKEISEARFVSFQDAVALVGERIASRLPACEQALKEKRSIYLESIDGIKPTFIS